MGRRCAGTFSRKQNSAIAIIPVVYRGVTEAGIGTPASIHRAVLCAVGKPEEIHPSLMHKAFRSLLGEEIGPFDARYSHLPEPGCFQRHGALPHRLFHRRGPRDGDRIRNEPVEFRDNCHLGRTGFSVRIYLDHDAVAPRGTCVPTRHETCVRCRHAHHCCDGDSRQYGAEEGTRTTTGFLTTPRITG